MIMCTISSKVILPLKICKVAILLLFLFFHYDPNNLFGNIVKSIINVYVETAFM